MGKSGGNGKKTLLHIGKQVVTGLTQKVLLNNVKNSNKSYKLNSNPTIVPVAIRQKPSYNKYKYSIRKGGKRKRNKITKKKRKH